jgi:hypothetical protein
MLTDVDHRAIARYVVGMIRDDPCSAVDRTATDIPDGARWVKAEQLMARYQVSRKFLRSHAIELGATRLSDAANSKLRYHLPTADAFIDSHRKHRQPVIRAGIRRRGAQRSDTPNGAPLVPFT